MRIVITTKHFGTCAKPTKSFAAGLTGPEFPITEDGEAAQWPNVVTKRFVIVHRRPAPANGSRCDGKYLADHDESAFNYGWRQYAKLIER